MIKIELKTIFGEVAFTHESARNTIKTTVKALLEKFKGETIKDINLSGHNLSGIDFSNSTFYNSKFDNSTFDNSTFYNSTFYNSKFDNSTFDNSKFDNSTFDNSTFYNSKFYNSKFDEVSAKSAELSGSLESIKTDFFGRMLILKKEVPALKQALIDGRIDGFVYSGECCCFMGTVAKAAKCKYTELPGLRPDSSSNTERWFMGLRKGYTPENNQIARITLGWIEEFETLIKKK